MVITSDEWQIAVQEGFFNHTCVSKDFSFSRSTTRTHSVSTSVGLDVTGSTEWAAGKLFVKCKAAVSAKVSGSRVWGEEESVTVTTNTSTTLAPCSVEEFVLRDRKRTCEGSIDVWDCKTVCQCTMCAAKSVNYCNYHIVTGAATGWLQSEAHWYALERPENCEDCDHDPVTDPPEPVPDENF